MKKSWILALILAIVLAGTLAFLACGDPSTSSGQVDDDGGGDDDGDTDDDTADDYTSDDDTDDDDTGDDDSADDDADDDTGDDDTTDDDTGDDDTYYDGVDASSPAVLRQTLHATIDDHVRYPYTSTATDTWDILDLADEDPNDDGRILDVYKNESYPKFGGGNDFYNREHSWPKSFGFPDDNSGNYPYTDCHMLFLCDSGYNSSRTNHPYRNCGESCPEKPTVYNNGRGGGSGIYPGNSNWRTGSQETGTWETWIGRRGDVARALFYGDVRYEGGTHGATGHAEPDLILCNDQALIAAGVTGNNEPVAHMGMLSDLLGWHYEDAVDDAERIRNDVVFSFQGNRNPFVDHPEWVGCLFEDIGCQ